MLEYVIWRYWKNVFQDKAAVGERAADELAALEAVAEAARTGKGLDDALDALDALKGAE